MPDFDVQLDSSFSEDEAADVRRCLSTLYSVPKGSAPLARGFGLDWSCLACPPETARSLLAAEIVRQTARYEPRVRVDAVQWETGPDGQVRAKVVVSRA